MSSLFGLEPESVVEKRWQWHRHLSPALLLVVVFLIFVGLVSLISNVHAGLARFYPTMCSGGWENSNHVQGEPEVIDNDSLSFTAENSAVLANQLSQIICNGFVGDVPVATAPKQFKLKLSWRIVLPGEEDEISSEPPLISVIPVETEATSTELASTSTETELISTSTEATSTSEEVPVEPVLEEAVPTEPELTPEVPVVEESEPVTEPEPAAEEVSPTPAEEPVTLDWWQRFAASVAVAEPPSNPIFNLFYTVDGVTWLALGQTEISPLQSEFEIPLSGVYTWADISRIQIKIESGLVSDQEFTTYLDGMWIESEYDSAVETPLGEIEVDENFLRSLKEEYRGDEEVVLEINPELLPVEIEELVPVDVEQASSTESATTTEPVSTSFFRRIWNFAALGFLGSPVEVVETEVLGPEGEVVAVIPEITEVEGRLRLNVPKPAGFTPGAYLLKAKIKRGSQTFSVSQSFTWNDQKKEPIRFAKVKPEATELSAERTMYQKIYDNHDGTVQYIISNGILHYEAAPDEWEETDVAIQPLADELGYEMSKSIYQARFSEDFGNKEIISVQHQNKGFTLEPGSLYWNVAGERQLISDPKTVLAQVIDNKITYPGAYGSGLDFGYQTEDGRVSKRLVINDQTALPPVLTDEATLELDLEFKLDSGLEVLIDEENRTVDFKRGEEILWRLAPPRAWDSSASALAGTDQGSSIQGGLKALQQGNKLLVTISFPSDWLQSAEYPITIDPDTYYGDTSDGYINGNNPSYATAQSTSAGFLATGDTLVVGQYYGGFPFLVYRSFLEFDTSGIVDNYVISQVNLALTPTTDATTDDFDIRVHKYNWSSPISSGNQEANYDGALASTYDALWRNSSGLSVNTTYSSSNLDTSWISKTATTSYALLSSVDVSASEPPATYGRQGTVSFASQAHATTGYRPYLSVTATPPPIITVSGTAYQNNESTAATSQNVALRVNGGTASTTVTHASTGAFSFAGLTASAGDTITLYFYGANDTTAGTYTGNTITVTDSTTNITGIKLIDDHVVIRADNSTASTTIADMTDYDNDDNAANLLFTATDTTVDTLSLEAGVELYIDNSDPFKPTGNVTAPTVKITSGATLDIAGYNLVISGTGTPFVATGSFLATSASSTVRYTGSGSATTIATVPYYHLEFTPSSATTYNLAGSLTSANAMAGDLILNSNATVDLRPVSTNYDLSLVNMKINSGGVLDATSAASTITVSGNWTLAGTFTIGTSTVVLTHTVGNVTIITPVSGAYYDYKFYNLTIAAGANKVTWTTGTSIATGGTMTINAELEVASGRNVYGAGNLAVAGTGTISGAGVFTQRTANGMSLVISGTVTVSRVSFAVSQGATTAPIPAATYGGDLRILNNNAGSATTTPEAGTITVGGSLVFYHSSAGATIAINNTNNTNFVVGSALDFKFGQVGNVRYVAGTETWTMNGSIAQPITLPTSGGLSFYNLTVANTAASPSDSVDVDPNGVITVTNNLTINDGQFQPDTYSIFKNVTIGAAGILKPSGSLFVGGNWTNSGTYTYSTGQIISFNGSADQTISGSAAHTFFTIDINKSAGDLILGANAAVTASPGYSGIVFESLDSSFNLATYNLTLTGSSEVLVSDAAALGGALFTATSDAGKLVFQATSTLVVESTDSVSYDFGNIQIDNGVTVDLFDSFGAGVGWGFGSVNISGAGAVFNTGGLNISVSGNWTNTGTFTGSGINFTATDAGNTIAGGATTYGPLTFSGVGAWSLVTNNLSASTLSQSNGTLDLVGQDLTLSGELLVSGGIFDASDANADLNLTSVELAGGTFYAPTAADDTSFLVSGAWTVGAGATFTPGAGTVVFDGAADQTIITGGKAFNAVTINNTGASGSDDLIISGTLDVNGLFTLTNGDLDLSTYDPNLTLADDFTVGASGSVDASAYSGTILFDGNGTKTWTDNTASGQSYGAVSVDGSSKVIQLAGSATSRTISTLSIAASNIFSLAGETVSVTTLSNNGTFKLQGWENPTITNQDINSGTFEYAGGTGSAGSFTIKDFGATDYYNLLINDTSTPKDSFKLGATLTVAATTTISASMLDLSVAPNQLVTAALDINGGTLSAASGDIDVNGNLILSSGVLTAPTAADDTSFTVAGNWTKSGGTFTPGTGTVVFNGTTDQTITSGGQAFNAVTMNNTGASGSDDLIISGNWDVNGTLTVTNGNLDTNASNPLVNLAGNVTFASNGSLTSGYGVLTFDGTGTSILTDNTAGGLVFGNVTLSGSSKTIQLAGSSGLVTINGDFIIAANQIFNLAGMPIEVGGIFYNDGLVKLVGSENPSFFNQDTNSGTFEYYGDGAGATTTHTIYNIGGSPGYYNLIINDTAASNKDTFQLGADIAVVGNLTNASGTLALSTYDLDVDDTVTVTGGSVIGGSGTMTFGTLDDAGGLVMSGGNFRAASIMSVDGFSLDLTGGSRDWTTNNSSSTFSIPGLIDLPADTFHHLTLEAASGGTSVNLANGLTVAGNLLIDDVGLDVINVYVPESGTLTIGGNFNIETAGPYTSLEAATSSTITVAGNWNNNGTFVPGTGTVVLSGVNQTITGVNNFYNLTKADTTNDSTNRTLTFPAGATTTVSGLLTFDGYDADDRVVLVSSSPGTYWKLKADGTLAIDYVQVTDSDASSGITITHTNSLDGGHNLNWIFGITISGTLYNTDEVTAITGSAFNVALRKNGGPVQVTTTNSGDGTFSFATSTSAGDTLTLYLYGASDTTAGTHLANTVTITDGVTNISGLQLIKDRVVIRSDNGTASTTIADMADYDNDQNANNLMFDADSGFGDTLSTEAGKELFIASGHKFKPAGTVTIGTGGLDLNGSWDETGAEVLTITGNFDSTGGVFNRATGTVKFTTTSTITGSQNYHHVEFNAVTSGRVYTITAGTVITSNGTLSLTGNQVVYFLTGAIHAKGDISLTNTGLPTSSTSSTGSVTINGSGDQVLAGGAILYASILPSVIINKPSGNLTMTGIVTAGGHWTYTGIGGGGQFITTGSTLAINFWDYNACTVTGSHSINNLVLGYNANVMTLTVAAGTVLTVLGNMDISYGFWSASHQIAINTGDIHLKGNLTMSNAATTGGGTGIITLNGTGTQTLTGTSTPGQGKFPSLTINKTSGTLNLVSTISTAGNWTYTAGTVDAGSSTVVTYGTKNLDGQGTSATMTFNNLQIGDAAVAAVTTVTGALDVNGNLVVSSGRTLTNTSHPISVAGNWTNSGTFTSGTGTVTFDGSGNSTIVTGGNGTGQDFASTTVAKTGSGVVQLSTNGIDIDNNLTISSGTLDLNGQTLTSSASTTATCINSGTLKLSGDELVFCTSAKTTNNSGATVEYYASSGTRAIQDWVYYNLKINGSGGTFTFPAAKALGGALQVSAGTLTTGSYAATTTGSLIVDGGAFNAVAAGTVDVGANVLITAGSFTSATTTKVAGNWTLDGGSFAHSNGTVIFSGLNQTINDATNFYNLTKADSTNDSTNRTLTFPAGATTTVSGLLTFDGYDANDRVLLISSSPGTYWGLTANGTFAIDYVHVTDSDAMLGTTISHTNSEDGGHNLNWGFGVIVSCSTNVSELEFGILVPVSIGATNAPATTTVNCNYSGGCTLYVQDAGSGGTPGLVHATSSSIVIPSVSTTLSAGTEGYGIQAATSSTGSGVSLSLPPVYRVSGDTVGALATTNSILATSSGLFSNREVVVNHKAAVAAVTPVGDYSDIITYSCVAN